MSGDYYASVRIFVDVGGHYGETMDVALDPRWGFERVYCLEPSGECQSLLRGFRDSRIILDDRGLSNRNGGATLHGSGLLGGSIYADKPQGAHGAVEDIRLVRASEWLRERAVPGDEVYLKLNCEGSEADVLTELMESDAIKLIRSIYVDFDIAKIPSQAHRQELVENELRDGKVPYMTPAGLGMGGNPAVRAWLSRDVPTVKASPVARLRHTMRLYLPPYLMVKNVLTAFLPRTAYMWLGNRFGRRARNHRH